LKNPNRRLSVDDALFLMVLVIPAIVATSCYLDSEREMTALARSQEAANGRGREGGHIGSTAERLLHFSGSPASTATFTAKDYP